MIHAELSGHFTKDRSCKENTNNLMIKTAILNNTILKGSPTILSGLTIEWEGKK